VAVPQDPVHLPRLAEVRPVGSRGGQLAGVHRDAVRLDVIRVAVVADGVVGAHDLRAPVADYLDEVVGGLQEIGSPERSGDQLGHRDHATRLVAVHAGVVVAAGAAEEDVVGDADDFQSPPEFLDAVLP